MDIKKETVLFSNIFLFFEYQLSYMFLTEHQILRPCFD